MKKFHHTNFKLHLLLSKVINMRDSLSIQNISKSYNDTTVFKLISFNINPGKIYNLSGSNGAGKTTLMKIVASQILDYSGEIFLGKDNIKDLDHYYFTKVSYLPPLPNLYQHLSVIENIVFFTQLNNIRNAELAESLIHSFNLNDFKSKKIYKLSDGTKKKVSILILFLINPDFFILDEPYTYLDSESINVLNNLIINSTDKGKSFFITDNSSGLKGIEFFESVKL